MSRFVHLSVHSEYSLVDGVVRVPELAESVRAKGMPAVALTDHMNVFAMVKFYKAAINHGLKPLIGADIRVAESPRDAVPTRLTLLCANAAGFHNLSRMLSLAYSRRQGRGEVLVLKRWLETDALDGLIALSGGQYGEVGWTLLGTRPERAAAVLDEWLIRFPQRFYIELHRVGWPEESDYLDEAVRLAATHGIPVVATNPVRFLNPDNHREDEPNDFEAHEVRVCIQQGKTLNDPRRSRAYTEHQYLKSPAEMEELFGDLPEALSNSVEIARRCSFELELDRPCLPDFKVPSEQTAAAHLREMTVRGLGKRGVTPAGNGAIPFSDYAARLENELDVICEMGFEGYFLIVADFCGWAREKR
ncbi:MAG: PHP domain-containing protein, partial [Proteobacteria bacterium]|nr:PHP domain-containing protein [Pseudomonadota bacterium]